MLSLNNNRKHRSLTETLRPVAWAGVLGGIMLVGAPPAQAKLLGLSEQDEIQAGKEVAAQAEKEYGGVLPSNDPMVRRVRALGQRFANLSTRKNIPFSYNVLNNEEVLNAFAAPGGPVFVTKKLIETTSNDAELAYVLGHETGHIERKHVVKQVEKQQKVGIFAGILGAVIGRGRSGNIIGSVANVGWTVISRGYSRDDESEADAVGVRWMSQLGYDPRAAVSMLGKLGDGGGGGLDKYLSTHPAPKERQARVQNQIQQENLLDVAKKHGGPRLATNGDGSGYTVTGYDSTDSSAPEDYSAPVYYPPADTLPSTGQVRDQEMSFGAPLIALQRDDSQVVMAPVSGFVRWSGASMQAEGNTYTVRRANNVLELRRYSTAAVLNNRSIRLPAPPDVYDGLLYAPLGNLAEGVGARATLDSGTRTVHLALDNNSTGYIRVP